MKRLIPKSRFSRRPTTVDSVKHRIKISGTDKTNIPLLSRCQNAWENLSDFRATRLRNFRYVFGDQWGDIVVDKDGKRMKERDSEAYGRGRFAEQSSFQDRKYFGRVIRKDRYPSRMFRPAERRGYQVTDDDGRFTDQLGK